MEKFDIPADQRLIARLVRGGTQASPIRALLELITNSDDSYRRLENEGKPSEGIIELLYEKEGSAGRFTVRDSAEGMSYIDLSAAFRSYGAATSGLQNGKSVTGFFGTGAKNALAGMSEGRIRTFKGDEFCDFSIYLQEHCLKGELDGPRTATRDLRSACGVIANGTAASFLADPSRGQKVPRFDTVHESLANHWRLRKIMTNFARKVYLADASEKKKRRRLRYTMPSGEERVKERFTVACENYGDFTIDISIRRADSELRQEGDDRPGGLLVIDDRQATLDISLFKYDREPLAARLFGEVSIGGFRELLAKEEPVLDEKREGLNRSHLVCKAIIGEIERRIERLVQEESRKQREAAATIDDEERTRYRDAFKVLNEIAEAEAEETRNLGQDPSIEVEPPANGFSFYPDSAHVTVGKRYSLELRVDTERFRPGTLVRMSSSTPQLHIIGKQDYKVPKPTKGSIARRYITVQGTDVGRATLRGEIGKNVAEATLFVDPEKEENEHLFKYGLVFRPESLTVRLNRTRKATLRTYVKLVEGGTRISLKSDHETVHVWPEEITVNEADARRHVAEYEIEVWGEEADVTAMVIAECEGHDALLEVRVRLEEEKERPKGQGMFGGEPHFEQEDQEPLQRTSYSRETGKVTIYVNFPSVRFYLGQDLSKKKSLAAQVMLADLIAERCFFEMARAKKRDVAISPEAAQERIQRDAQELSRKYGERVHKTLVDQSLLEKDQAAVIGCTADKR